MAGQTFAFSIMLACTEYCVADVVAGAAMSSFPVNASTRPCASIMATCRTSRCASAASSA